MPLSVAANGPCYFQIPKHRCLRLVSNAEQPLSLRMSRRLITMEKVSEWDDARDQRKRKEARRSEDAKDDETRGVGEEGRQSEMALEGAPDVICYSGMRHKIMRKNR